MKRLFMDAIVLEGYANTSLAKTKFVANTSYNGVVSARGKKSDAGTVFGPVINAIVALLTGRVSAAITNGNDNPDYPVYYTEIQQLDGSIVGVLYDSANNTYKYEYEGIDTDIFGGAGKQVSEVVVLPRIIDALANIDSEAISYFDAIKKDYNDNGVISTKDAIRFCDLFYRYALYDLNGGDIDLDSFEKVDSIVLTMNEKGKPIEIVKNISSCYGKVGTFQLLEFGSSANVEEATSSLASTMTFATEDEIPEKYRTNPAYNPNVQISKMDNEIIRFINYVMYSKDTSMPVNTAMFFGPTGSGKSYTCKMIAKKLGVPYIAVACSNDKDTSFITGMYQNGEGGKTIYVNSKFSEYITIPCVIEMVESNSLDEDILLALNSLKDKDYGYLVTDNFETIKRNPKCIIIDTFNPGYAGTLTPNRSVVRRAEFTHYFKCADGNEIKEMIKTISGVNDDKCLNIAKSVFDTTENYIRDNEIDGEVSMTEYADVARFLSMDMLMGQWNPLSVIRSCVANKLFSSMNFDVEEIDGYMEIIAPVVQNG